MIAKARAASKSQKSRASQRAQRNRAESIFDELAALWPEAHCELEHYNDFQLLVAVVLSAQTTDVSVNRCFGAYVREHRSFGPADLVHMGETKFLALIRSIGLAPTKAHHCVALSRRLLDAHDGHVPADREALEQLPGVGRKTANVVLNVLHGLPTMAVDTHVARLAVRLGFVPEGTSREKIEHALLGLVPQRHAAQAHHFLIFHGRYLCTARKPRCTDCKLLSLCPRVGVTSSH